MSLAHPSSVPKSGSPPDTASQVSLIRAAFLVYFIGVGPHRHKGKEFDPGFTCDVSHEVGIKLNRLQQYDQRAGGQATTLLEILQCALIQAISGAKYERG